MVTTREHQTLITPPSRILSEKHRYFDYIVRDVAEQREMPDYKRSHAEDKYTAVSTWLDNSPDDDPLSTIPIKIYTIGSFLSSTPVKPQSGDEFDVDMAGELQLDYRQYPDPRAAVDIFEKRLRKNKKYDEIAERKTRVIRLNYAGDFYLDFMPCFPTYLGDSSSTAIKIPHKVSEGLYIYKDSDPLGLNRWFEQQCAIRRLTKMALDERIQNDISPFPEHQNNKPPLKLALQMLKNARNLFFVNDDEGKKDVKTVILQVLLARNYNGEQNVFLILLDAVNRMYGDFYLTLNPVIENPINPKEDFAEKWRSDPERLAVKKFQSFLLHCRELLLEADSAPLGLASSLEPLKKLFGSNEIDRAINRIGESVTSGSRKGKVGVTAAGAITSSSVQGTTKLRGHEFYGSK